MKPQIAIVVPFMMFLSVTVLADSHDGSPIKIPVGGGGEIKATAQDKNTSVLVGSDPLSVDGEVFEIGQTMRVYINYTEPSEEGVILSLAMLYSPSAECEPKEKGTYQKFTEQLVQSLSPTSKPQVAGRFRGEWVWKEEMAHDYNGLHEFEAPNIWAIYCLELWRKGLPTTLIDRKQIRTVVTEEKDALDFGGRYSFAPGEEVAVRVQTFKERYWGERSYLLIPTGTGIAEVGRKLPKDVRFVAPKSEGRYTVWLYDRDYKIATASFEVRIPERAFVVNGSFEHPRGTSTDWTTHSKGDMTVDGWVVASGSVDRVRDSYFRASDGSFSIDLNGSSVGSIYQDLVGLSVGESYTVTFDMTGNPDGGPAVKSLTVSAGGSQRGFDFHTASRSRNSLGWVTQEFQFVAQSETERLEFKSTNAGDFGAVIDNIRIK